MLKDEEYINEIINNQSLKAYKVLVERYENRVYTLCYTIIKNREESQEVAQDVFVICFKKLNRLKEKNKFPNWLMKIAYSKAIDQIRKKKINKTDLNNITERLIKEDQTPVEEVILQDRKIILKNAINRLETIEATLITLYYIEDLPIKQISEITGLSLSNIKVKLFRARITLKTIISSMLKTDLGDFIQN